MPPTACFLAPVALLLLAGAAPAEEPLHKRIDALIARRANGQPLSPVADDAEFLRRVSLDLAGKIPSAAEARAFLQDAAPDRRERLVDRLLASPAYPRRMQEVFHVMYMERLGDSPDWANYLKKSFEANKPYDQLAREILRGANDEATKGASFFYSKRLENYGQNPVDYPALTRDVGRLFLGVDLRCAQCHDHLFIKDYKQADFQGLYAFFKNAYLQDAAKLQVGEKPTTEKTEFMSVFTKEPRKTGPRLPGRPELEIPPLEKGKEYETPPDPKTKSPGVLKLSPLAKLAEQLPTADNQAFVRNGVNRLWFVLMGRGIVHPLDLFHSGNPPSHPELLDLLSQEFVAHKFDVKWLLREIALSETYQRSSFLPEGVEKVPPESFRTAVEKRLSAEQLLASVLEATGERETEALRAKFLKAFSNPAREPEDEFQASLKAALFVLNDPAVLGLLEPRDGNLADRLRKLPDADQVAEELFLGVLTRMPTAEERALVARQMEKHMDRREAALKRLAWALLASTEFCVNH